jgi:hypothetical protein
MSLGLLQKSTVRRLPPRETLPPDDDDAQLVRVNRLVKNTKR